MSASKRRRGYLKTFSTGDRVVIVRGRYSGRRAIVKAVHADDRLASVSIAGTMPLWLRWGSLVHESVWDRDNPYEPDGLLAVPGFGTSVY